MTTEITRLLTRTGAAGERTEFTLTLDGVENKGSRFTGHYGTARGAGRPPVDCLYKVAPGEWGRRALRNEIAVFSTLGWAGMRDGRFAELLGYDLDPDEGGAVLVQTRRGRALSRRKATGVPTAEQLWRPTHDLLSALALLAEHNYVHGAVSSTTVFWDGEGLQIADLSTATTQEDGDGFVRDVRNAAGLLYWLASGEASSLGYHGEGASPDQEFRYLSAHRPDLAMVLRPVYDGEPATAEALLDRMRGWPRPAHLPEKTSHDGPGGDRPGPDVEKTHEIDDDPSRPHVTRPVPRVTVEDREQRQFKKYLGERLTNMHDQPAAGPLSADPVSVPASRPPRPEPGSLPSLPEGFPFRAGDGGTRTLHPLAWAAVIALAVLILLLLVVSI